MQQERVLHEGELLSHVTTNLREIFRSLAQLTNRVRSLNAVVEDSLDELPFQMQIIRNDLDGIREATSELQNIWLENLPRTSLAGNSPRFEWQVRLSTSDDLCAYASMISGGGSILKEGRYFTVLCCLKSPLTQLTLQAKKWIQSNRCKGYHIAMVLKDSTDEDLLDHVAFARNAGATIVITSLDVKVSDQVLRHNLDRAGVAVFKVPPIDAEKLLFKHYDEDLLLEVERRNPVCTVCLDDMQVGQDLIVLPSCEHAFHDACILRWLEQQLTCPTCREEFPRKRQRIT